MNLISQAKHIMEQNYLKIFIKPAPSLYPYQWNWDSGFVDMAYAHYDIDKSLTELESLFMGQWSNGMLPQIVFSFSFRSVFSWTRFLADR